MFSSHNVCASAVVFLTWLFCGASFAQQPKPGEGKPAPTSFTSIESIAALVPPSVNIGKKGKWNPVGVEQANEAIKTNAKDRPAKLRLKVQVFEPFKERGWGYRIMAPDDEVSIRGTKVSCRVWAYIKPEQAAAFSKVHKGSTVTVSGTLGRADIEMFSGVPWMCVDLNDAIIETDK